MVKQEAILELKKKDKEGYITHSMLLVLYEDGEEIPESMQEMLWHLPIKPRPIIMYLGTEGMKRMEEVLNSYINERI